MRGDLQKPVEYESDASHTKVEDLLLDCLNDLFHGLRGRNGLLWDESLDWIEFLLSYEETSYNELKEFKEKLKNGVALRLAEVQIASRNIDNELKKKRFQKLNKSMIENEFRRDMTRKVVELFYKRQILMYRKTTFAELEGVDDKQNTA